MGRYLFYLKAQTKFFLKSGMYLLIIFVLFLVALDLYGRQMIYVDKLDVYAPSQYQRNIPLVRWVSSKNGADAYLDDSGTLHIQTYNQLKRNMLIYLFTGESSDWRVVIVKPLIRFDMSMWDFYDTLYGVIYMLIIVSFTIGYDILMHKIRRTGMLWHMAGLSKWEIVALEMLFVFALSLVALFFKMEWDIYLILFFFLAAFGLMSGLISKDVQSYITVIKVLSIFIFLPVLYFFFGDKIPRFLWYLLPTFHPVMVLVSPIMKTPLSFTMHAILTLLFSLAMIILPLWFVDFS